MKRRGGRSRSSRRLLAVLALVASGSVLALLGTPAGAAPEKVNGQFQLQSTTARTARRRSLCVVTGGTGAWTGAHGYLRTTGTFTFGSGGSGSYDGRVVTP